MKLHESRSIFGKGNFYLELQKHLNVPPQAKANQKLIEFLADALDVAKSDITIKTGQTGKRKLLEIGNLSPEELKERLERLINVS